MLYVRSGCGRAAFSFHTALHPGNEQTVDKQSGNTTESLTEHLNHWGANYVSKCALSEAQTCRRRNPCFLCEEQASKRTHCGKRWRLPLWCQGAVEQTCSISLLCVKGASQSPHALPTSSACKVKCVIAFLKGVFVPIDPSCSSD